MKKRAIILSMLVILLVFQLFRDINSQVDYIEGNKVYTAFPVADVPITVNKETLTVDNKLENMGYVNDNYIMTNTTSEKVKVPMILPILKNKNEHKNICVSVNDEKIEYKIKWLLNDEKCISSDNNDIKLQELVSDFNYKENYKFKNIDPNEKIWVYEILLKEEKNLIKIENNKEPLKILYVPANIDKFKVNNTMNYTEFSMDKGSQDKYQIILFDKQIHNIKFDCNTKYIKKQMRLKQYIRQVINRHYNIIQVKPQNVDMNTELLPNVLYYIDQKMELNDFKIVPLENILINYIDLVYYNIEFEPNEVKTMKLRYDIQSTYDKRKTIEPIYTFVYDFSTSKYWKAFNGFDIKVNLGENYKYLIESSIPFENDQNKYISSLNYISDSPISYSIYSENIKLADVLELNTKKKIKVVSFALFMLLLICVVSKIATRKKKEILVRAVDKND